MPANKDRTITEGEVEQIEDALDKLSIEELYNIFPVQEGNGVPQYDSCGYCKAHHSYDQGCDHCDAGGRLADHYSQDEEMYEETAEVIFCNKCHNPVAINNTTDNEQATFTLFCGSCKTITGESDGTYESDWEDTEDEEEYLTADEDYDSKDDSSEADKATICNICKEAKEVGGNIKTTENYCESRFLTLFSGLGEPETIKDEIELILAPETDHNRRCHSCRQCLTCSPLHSKTQKQEKKPEKVKRMNYFGTV